MSGKTSTISKAMYNAKAYDRLYITVYKGQKAMLEQIAQQEGKSLNTWVNDLIADKVPDFVSVASGKQE